MQVNTETPSSIPFRPLGLVKTALDRLGMEITYVHEDLIFLEHNYFLLQFGDAGEDLLVYTNKEAKEGDVITAIDLIAQEVSQLGITLSYQGMYALEGGEEEELRLAFYDFEE